MTKIIFDLDHTLFRTNAFKADLFKVFDELGVARGVVETSYFEYCKKENGGAYDFLGHCEKIVLKGIRLDLDNAQKAYSQFLEKLDFSKYLEDGAFDFFKKQKSMDRELILLTKGGEKVQQLKFERSGLGGYFDKFFVCRDTKLPVLSKINLEKGDLIINDLVEETLQIKETYPQLDFIVLDLEQINSFREIELLKQNKIKRVLSISELEI